MAKRKIEHPITPAEIRAQRAGGECLMPGIWADKDGDLHFSIPDLLEVFGWPDDDEHRAMVERVVEAALVKMYPGVPIVTQPIADDDETPES